jgi:AbrB family looped-hinge helix DNA binding protein
VDEGMWDARLIGKSIENEKLKKIYVYCKANLTYGEAIEMINVAITKLSSKGQIVIPSEMRDDFSKGEKLVIIKSGKQLILKKVSDLGKNFEEDLAFAKKTEEAWQSYESGEFVSLPADKFLEELEKC